MKKPNCGAAFITPEALSRRKLLSGLTVGAGVAGAFVVAKLFGSHAQKEADYRPHSPTSASQANGSGPHAPRADPVDPNAQGGPGV